MANPENFFNHSNIDILLQAQPMTSEGGKSSSSGFSQLITPGNKTPTLTKCQQNFLCQKKY